MIRVSAAGPDGPAREPKMNFEHIRNCKRCGIRYDWRRSPSSSLKMTYCGSLCEHADLGFTIEAMLAKPSPARRAQPAAPVIMPRPEPVAV